MANGDDTNLTTEDRLHALMVAESIARQLAALPKKPMRDVALEQARWLLSGTLPFQATP